MRYLILALMAGCGSNPYAADNYLNVTNYEVNYTQYTPKGVGVDGDLNLTDIDRRTDEVEACLQELFPDGTIPADIVKDSSCISAHFDLHIQRAYVGVKLAPDWYAGCYNERREYVGKGNGEQVFPGKVDNTLCEAKGIKVTAECPCAYRAIIQDNTTIITAPNMHVYKAELIRLVTGCNNIWTSKLASCYSAN